MSEAFDPYFKWLSIPPEEQPPNHYRLLGVPLFVSDLDVISNAADRQMSHLRTYQTGPNSVASQKLLNDISAVRLCLLNTERKAAYDQQLRAQLAKTAKPSIAPAPAPQPSAPSTHAAPANPYGDLDLHTSSTDQRNRKKPKPQETKPKWLMPALLGVAAILVVAIVALAMSGTGSKASVAKKEAPLPPPEPVSAPAAPVKPTPPPMLPATPVQTSPPAKTPVPAAVAPAPATKAPIQPAAPLKYELKPGEVDVIAAIDLEKDVLAGHWDREGDSLVSAKGNSTIYLASPKARDYSLTAVLERVPEPDIPLNRVGGFSIDLIVDGRKVKLVAEAARYYCTWGLELVDGQGGAKNETYRYLRVITAARPVCTVVCTIRGNHIVVTANEQTLVDWEGDPQRLSLPPGADVPDKSRLVLTANARFRFTRLTLTPLVDAAQPAPPPAVPEKPAPPFVVPATFARAPFNAQLARTYQEAWAKRVGLPVESANSIGMRFKLVPPGEFLMGSTPDQIAKELKKLEAQRYYIDGEGPQHRVVLTQPYLVGTTEVTIGQFQKFLDATDYVSVKEKAEIADRITQQKFGQDEPARYVSWDQAVAYCVWLSEKEGLDKPYEMTGENAKVLSGNGYRLPTEAQWEFACRAGTTSSFYFGEDDQKLTEYGWYNSRLDGSARPHIVANLEPNAFGLFDMSGNVFEWCQDPYDPVYYAESPVQDPPGSTRGSPALRGGSWGSIVYNLRSATRYTYAAGIRSAYFGFRVIRNLESP